MILGARNAKYPWKPEEDQQLREMAGAGIERRRHCTQAKTNGHGGSSASQHSQAANPGWQGEAHLPGMNVAALNPASANVAAAGRARPHRAGGRTPIRSLGLGARSPGPDFVVTGTIGSSSN